MKFILLPLVMMFSLNVFASRGTENCFRSKNVVPGQFIVMLEEGLGVEEKNDIVNYLASLGLSVVNTIAGETLLVERTALSAISTFEEKKIVSSLQSLVGQGVEVVTCNQLVHALRF